ncbi:MAG: LutB/LldF family L-lactate oxidation iron-sulfur protein, partial [Thermodesulfobacteriota bacterium]
MPEIKTERYKNTARIGIKDQVLQRALANLQERFGRGTEAAYLNLPEGPELRFVAHDIRMEAIDNLDFLIEMLAENIRKNGGKVFFADTAQEAVSIVKDIAGKHHVKRVVKGKSMVSEEIGLNEGLSESGIEVTETDLGEYIIQLAQETPSHIIAPAIHKTRIEIGKLFEEKLGIPFTSDPPTLTRAARKALREKFLNADMGISGCNLACAETGHITTVSNEGNIRMAGTLPRVHVSLMGMERVAARLVHHEILLRLLAMGAAAQHMATYVSYIGGPRRNGETDGPDAFYLVVIDNGRSKILSDRRFKEMLCCIRCAACLNVCPVYRKIGGHSYGFPYSGPVGAVVTPLLVGVNRAGDLCRGETLCGACQDACPVAIDIPRMLLELRRMLAEGDPKWNVSVADPKEHTFYRLWSWIVQHPRAYDFISSLMRKFQTPWTGKTDRIESLPGPLSGWTFSRDFPKIPKERFIHRWKREQ